MKNFEKQIVEFIVKHISIVMAIIAFGVAVIIRKQGMEFVSGDYEFYLYPWYEQLKMNAGFKGLALDFYTYYINYHYPKKHIFLHYPDRIHHFPNLSFL